MQAAVEAQVAAGAPGALARFEAPRADLTWGGSAGYLARGSNRALQPDDAFRAASVTKSVTAAVAVSLAHQDHLGRVPWIFAAGSCRSVWCLIS
jgi:CubicO group peptidase (beta-lactamase class C family)